MLAEPKPRAPHRLLPRLLLYLFLWLPLAGTHACIKSTRVVPVPDRIRQAQTLSRAELTELLGRREAAVQSLQVSSMKAYFVGGDEESGKMERYLGVPGYLLAQRPNYLRITLQNPVTRSSLADLISNGDAIKIWIPRHNKFLIGSATLLPNDSPKASENPLSNLRPQHILPALFFDSPFSAAGSQTFLEEESDSQAKYYVIGALERGEGDALVLRRRIWVERSQLQITREKYYSGDGTVTADIHYRRYESIEGLPVAVQVELQRQVDHYSLTLELNRVKLNQAMQAESFDLQPPPGAELVRLEERRP